MDNETSSSFNKLLLIFGKMHQKTEILRICYKTHHQKCCIIQYLAIICHKFKYRLLRLWKIELYFEESLGFCMCIKGKTSFVWSCIFSQKNEKNSYSVRTVTGGSYKQQQLKRASEVTLNLMKLPHKKQENLLSTQNFFFFSERRKAVTLRILFLSS